MENDVTVYDATPAIADDSLISIAKQAEARIDAVIKIKQLALKVTNANDWTDQQDKPYIQASGSEKVANLFNISWGFLTPEPLYEEDEDGHYTYTFKGRFTMGGRTIEVEGSRSSRDKFFAQYDYPENGPRTERHVRDRDNKRDVKMAALTNLLGNGITRILGIRNLTWEDLEAFANIKQADVKGKVQYKSKGKGKESNGQSKAPEGETVSFAVAGITHKEGKKNDNTPYTIYTITDQAGNAYKTFDKKLADSALAAREAGVNVKVTFKKGKYGNDITGLEHDVPEGETASA
jgi:hypothetical protein